MATRRNLTGVTRTGSGIVIVPAYAAGNAINAAVAERKAAQQRVKAMNEAAKKLGLLHKGKKR